MLSKKNLYFIFSLISLVSFSQVKVGQWADHLSYNTANSVAKVGNLVYFSNGSGLATYNTSDNSVEKLTKINGLSDVGVILLRKNNDNNYLLVIYENANIDIIKPNGDIINVSDIKRKIIPGKKNINEVYFSGKLAYISCGFGIVVFDTDKLEIKDTYYIGNGVSNIEVYQVTKNDTAVFAATTNGVYFGNVKANLSNYQSWKTLNTGIPSGIYNSIVNFDHKIIANLSIPNVGFADTIYQYDGVTWGKYPYKSNSTNKNIYAYPQYNKLLINDQWGIRDYSNTGINTAYISYYGFDNAQINDVFFENDGHYWLADNRYGLINSQGAAPYYANEVIKLNGPDNSYVNDIDIQDGVLAVAPINLGVTYTNQYQHLPPSVYKDNEWFSLKNIVPDSVNDINCVAIDPNDKNHMFFGSLSSKTDLVEVRNNKLTKIYNDLNSPLVGYNGSSDIRITGVNFDKKSNLWASITLGTKCISVLKANGTWALLNFQQFVVQPTVSKIIFTKNDQAWIVLPRNVGLMIYNDINGLSQPNSSNTKFLNTAIGNGHLPTTDIYSICEDKDGHVWLGTGKGIAVFYNPENVFTNANWDSQQILIEQDGHVQILLENDVVTAIAVDGVNRKWIGTESSGVYCMSADGQKEIYHFTEENSPLYSNYIRDIVTDETTGDIFIATDMGIQSFRTSIIKGFDDFTNVHAFPNPIRPGSSGPVYITGLIDETELKITDVSGNLVWATKSQGGQVEWNLQTFSGTKATSGVYMIYCASAKGDKSATTKLLIVN